MRRALIFGLPAAQGKKTARRLISAACAAGVLSIVTVSGALATPNAPGCLGESVSAAATAGGRELGQLASLTARTSTRGVGDEVQLILAGEFPDDAFPNTCND